MKPLSIKVRESDHHSSLELSNRMQLDIEYMQAVFGILNADDMAIPGFAQWLCEQGTHHPGLALTYMLIVTSLMVWARACRTVQPEVPPRDATMGSVFSGFATVCGHPCANHDAFGTAQGPEHAFATTKRCNRYTPSVSTHGLTFNGKADRIVCSVSPICYYIWYGGFIHPDLLQDGGQWSNYRTW
jgi:hypothetical protein